MRLLSFIAVVCFMLIIWINFIWGNKPEFIVGGEKLGSVINDLSIGFIAAYIFYLIDIWFPKQNEKKKVNERIAIPLSRILYTIKHQIDKIIDHYGNEIGTFENISKQDFMLIINKMDLINDVGPITTMSFTKVSYAQYLVYEINRMNNLIKQVNELPMHLDLDLIVILDKLRHCKYHEIMEAINKHSGISYKNPTNRISGTTISKYYYDYYLLFFELKDYMQKNNIKFTIKDL